MHLYLLGPSERSFCPLKLPASTSLEKVFFLLLGNFETTMVKMSCQLLFIEFFWPFLPLFDPLCHLSWLDDHLIPIMSFSLDVMGHFLFWFGNLLGMGHFWYPLVKVVFSKFLHIS
jgi:hypothetical protein